MLQYPRKEKGNLQFARGLNTKGRLGSNDQTTRKLPNPKNSEKGIPTKKARSVRARWRRNTCRRSARQRPPGTELYTRCDKTRDAHFREPRHRIFAKRNARTNAKTAENAKALNGSGRKRESA